jgi:hypothetical protein
LNRLSARTATAEGSAWIAGNTVKFCGPNAIRPVAMVNDMLEVVESTL